jgi:hypothetical protein
MFRDIIKIGKNRQRLRSRGLLHWGENMEVMVETEQERKERIRRAVNRRLKEIGEPHKIGQFLNHFDLNTDDD